MNEWLLSNFEIVNQPVLWVDVIALIWFAISWLGYSYYADACYHSRLNLVSIMDDMRHRWMQRMVHRENRVQDATLLGNIMRAISFFASTTILILMGLMTILGAQNAGLQILHSIPFVIGSTPLMFEFKLSLLLMIFIYAFFKLTWSMRQYNYVCIVVGAAPYPHEKSVDLEKYAERAGKLIGNAGRHFNMGLRAYYFGLAVVSWFLNGIAFMAVTSLVVAVVHRREFRSHTVNNLIALDE